MLGLTKTLFTLKLVQLILSIDSNKQISRSLTVFDRSPIAYLYEHYLFDKQMQILCEIIDKKNKNSSEKKEFKNILQYFHNRFEEKRKLFLERLKEIEKEAFIKIPKQKSKIAGLSKISEKQESDEVSDADTESTINKKDRMREEREIKEKQNNIKKLKKEIINFYKLMIGSEDRVKMRTINFLLIKKFFEKVLIPALPQYDDKKFPLKFKDLVVDILKNIIKQDNLKNYNEEVKKLYKQKFEATQKNQKEIFEKAENLQSEIEKYKGFQEIKNDINQALKASKNNLKLKKEEEKNYIFNLESLREDYENSKDKDRWRDTLGYFRNESTKLYIFLYKILKDEIKFVGSINEMNTGFAETPEFYLKNNEKQNNDQEYNNFLYDLLKFHLSKYSKINYEQMEIPKWESRGAMR